ncbi:MarR family winged helix-turn-helix transcriptional regulator [Cellulomonas sp. PhB143]|uniref:MarR family winged helix-turn-helix transcriptional regulator n=1 Tax=Cellulomonas sp. PhB143 TaxID=2485186 RepID=UPI000F906DAD|nr:MarR family winged helix-turn-helix transcriptional regulator [Cellulomonas sp. PhB143]ROS75312.1 DNA-binding MarR family transcriptional regulator [Cellulomonas sp. PhB143]
MPSPEPALAPSPAPSTASELAFELRAALGPIYRRLLAEKTLPLGQSRVLLALSARGGATSSELAAAEGITPQSMAAIVADLTERGLVARTRDTADRRRLTVTITSSGLEEIERDRHATQGWLAATVAARLDDGDRAALAAALPVLRRLTEEDTDRA